MLLGRAVSLRALRWVSFYSCDRTMGNTVPGGMISNLRHQLTQIKMLERLPEVLEEIVRVREDLGFPIMVTPYSQFVGV